MRLKSAEFVLKLGGSAITHKDSPFSPNMGVLESIAQELASLDLKGRMILVYGGGSFGHFVAEKYLKKGEIQSTTGISEIRSAMLSLSKIITETFLEHGLPIFCINASSCFTLRNGDVQGESSFLDPLALSLKLGLMPAIGGDVVLDSEGGARILSGDKIARLLAIQFKSKALLFGTDVDGILTADGYIKTIHSGEIPPILKKLGGRSGDVTGGIEGKVREISRYLSDGGGLSVIFNITKQGRLTKILGGEQAVGTYIRSELKRGVEP